MVSGPRSGFSIIQLMVVIALIGILVALLIPAQRGGREPARRTQCKYKLKQIAIALDNYVSEYHALPPAYTVDEKGKPLHSWRTLILPFLDNAPLYKKIDLTKAWDDPVNAEACKANLWAYRCPSADCPDGHTTYLAVVGPNGCFHPTKPRLLSAITDSHAETLMVLEVDVPHAVHWMAPTDADEALFLAISPKSALAHSGGTQAAFVDGHVEFLEAELPPAKRRALISISGKDR